MLAGVESQALLVVATRAISKAAPHECKHHDDVRNILSRITFQD
jgi:hypothetical protein